MLGAFAPELGTNLIAALTTLDVHKLAHGCWLTLGLCK
jgi:hypothetical protein